MSELATQLLTRHFGFTTFRGSQSQVIETVIRGGHCMLVAPTGSGKSLCYQIPALSFTKPQDLTVVLSPLIALMKDQVDNLQAKGVDASFINSSLTTEERKLRYHQLADNRFRLLYVTPERFRKQEFAEAIARRNVRLLAVDEAHCVSQWGHDFRPDYSRLAEIRQTLGKPCTIFLTATATQAVRDDILVQADTAAEKVQFFHEGIDRPNLSLEVEEVWDEAEKLDHLCDVASKMEQPGSGIVYVTLIKTLDRLSDQLRKRSVPHVCYHGQLPRNERRQIQERFLQNKSPLVLATNAFGMGIDKPDIRYVVHAETPASIESYYQEIGRAGRDGKSSKCLWLYNSEDLMTQMQFIQWRNPDLDFLHRTYHYLTEQKEQVAAFGLEWLNERLQRVSRHDHRLETTIALFDRYGVIAGPNPPECFQVTGEMPDELVNPDRIAEKLRADQMRLYAMVEFAKTSERDRQQFLRDYFAIN